MSTAPVKSTKPVDPRAVALLMSFVRAPLEVAEEGAATCPDVGEESYLLLCRIASNRMIDVMKAWPLVSTSERRARRWVRERQASFVVTIPV